MEEAGDGVGTNQNTEVTQRHGNLGGGSARPFQTRDGVTGGGVFEEKLDYGDDFGSFFFTGLRPPPQLRGSPARAPFSPVVQAVPGRPGRGQGAGAWAD